MPDLPDTERERAVLRRAEAAARALISEAAVVAARLKAEADNGHHAQLRADIAAVRGEVALVTKSVAEISKSVLGLQRASLRMFGLASLACGVLIFILSRVLGL